MYQVKLMAVEFMLDAHLRNYSVKLNPSTFTNKDKVKEKKRERRIVQDVSHESFGAWFCKLHKNIFHYSK